MKILRIFFRRIQKLFRLITSRILVPLILGMPHPLRKSRQRKFEAAPLPKKILVSFLSRGLGDCIYMGALLGAIRRRFQTAEISLAVLAQHESYFHGHPSLDRVIPCPDYEHGFLQNLFRFLNSARALGKKERFDLLLDLCPTLALEPALWSTFIPKRFSAGIGDSLKRIFFDLPVPIDWNKHFYEALLDGLRPFEIRPEQPEFWAPAGAPLDGLLPEDFKKEKSVVFAPGGKRNIEAPKDYCWIFEGFKDVIESLTARGVRVILTGAPYDRVMVKNLRPHPLMLDLVGKTSIAQVFTLVQKHARLVVCNNSGLLHAACALHVPTVSYADPQENMVRWGPYPDDGTHVYLQDTLTRKVTGEEFLREVFKKLEK